MLTVCNICETSGFSCLLPGQPGRRGGGILGPLPPGGPLPWVGGDKLKMKESAQHDGSEGTAGAGGGQAQAGDKKWQLRPYPQGAPCLTLTRPPEGLSIVSISQVRNLGLRESRQGCAG